MATVYSLTVPPPPGVTLPEHLVLVVAVARRDGAELTDADLAAARAAYGITAPAKKPPRGRATARKRATKGKRAAAKRPAG